MDELPDHQLRESQQPRTDVHLHGVRGQVARASEAHGGCLRQGVVGARQHGERRSDEVRLQGKNLQGFFMAYLNLNDYYITAPELELSHGYCDFFLLPDLTHYPTKHSYILELKVLQKGDSAEKASAQWSDAVEQIRRYAAAPRVEALRQGTTLHKIIMQFRGWELERMEEV